MTRIKKFQFHVGRDVHFAVIRQRDDLVCRLNAVFFVKQRLPVKFFAFFARLLAQIFRVPCLNARAVHHNQVGQVARGGRGVNVSVKAFAGQHGKQATVVVVRVGQDNGFNFIHGDFKITVLFVAFLPLSLKRAAVNHKRTSVNFKNMLRAGHFLCRPQ